MKVQVENVVATSQEENFEVINRVLTAVSVFSTLETVYEALKKSIDNTIHFKSGRGGNHLWVSNWNNERLIVITKS